MIQDFDPEWVRFANGFGGGIAATEDVCGALIGTTMIVGALYGRRDTSEDQSTSWRLCAEFRRRFLETFEATNCGCIKRSISEQWSHANCAETVRQAIKILLDLLAQESQGYPVSRPLRRGRP